MSKGNGPISQLWNGALLFAGAVLVIYFTLQVLASIWGWILLILGIAGVVAVAVVVLRWWWRSRSSRW